MTRRGCRGCSPSGCARKGKGRRKVERSKASRKQWLGCGSTLLVRAQQIISEIWGTEKDGDWILVAAFGAVLALMLAGEQLRMAVLGW